MSTKLGVFISCKLLLIGVALTGLTGCAWVTIEKGGAGKGYDVYRPEPYLLVFKQTTIATGTSTVQNQSNTNKTETDTSTGKGAGGSGTTSDGTDAQNNGGGGGSKQSQDGAPAAAEGLSGPGVTLIWLPNYSERYRVRSGSFLGKAGAQFTIRDGWMLTGVTDQSDSTTLVDSAMTLLSSAWGATSGSAAQAAKTAGTKAAGGQPATITTQTVELYKFLFDPDGNFYGMAQVQLDENTLDQIRLKSDAGARLVPIRAPNFKKGQLDVRPPGLPSPND
jgi:hypothetical protein